MQRNHGACCCADFALSGVGVNHFSGAHGRLRHTKSPVFVHRYMSVDSAMQQHSGASYLGLFDWFILQRGVITFSSLLGNLQGIPGCRMGGGAVAMQNITA